MFWRSWLLSSVALALNFVPTPACRYLTRGTKYTIFSTRYPWQAQFGGKQTLLMRLLCADVLRLRTTGSTRSRIRLLSNSDSRL